MCLVEGVLTMLAGPFLYTLDVRQTCEQFAQAPPTLFALRAGVPWWLRADYLKSSPGDAAAIIGEYLSAPADDVPSVDSPLDPQLSDNAR
jgi:hypothetical protein